MVYREYTSAYLLAGAALTPVYGKVSDILGRKAVLYPCVIIFLVSLGPISAHGVDSNVE